MCEGCAKQPVGPGKRKFCGRCAAAARKIARGWRREALKLEQAPAWRRNGWSSREKWRQCHREYMRKRRAADRAAQVGETPPGAQKTQQSSVEEVH